MDPSLPTVHKSASIILTCSNSGSDSSKHHYHNDASLNYQRHQQQQEKINIYAPGLATAERIPTSTWGPFTTMVVTVLVLLTCFILSCGHIRRKVNERRMDKLGRSGPFTFERRHKELQEADLEWNSHPPIVFTNEESVTIPESAYNSSSISSSSSNTSDSNHSSLSQWSSTNSTIAQQRHYNDREFIKNQPPSVQLRLTLENASVHNSPTAVEPARTSRRPMVLPLQNQRQQQESLLFVIPPPISSISHTSSNHNKGQNYNAPLTFPNICEQ